MKYYELKCPEMWWPELSSQWQMENVKQGIFCSVCHKIQKYYSSSEIDVHLSRFPKQQLIHFPFHTGIAIINKNIVDPLQEHWYPSGIILGDVYLSGEKLKDYNSMHSINPIDLRNGPYSAVNSCVECGTYSVKYKKSKNQNMYIMSYAINERQLLLDDIGTLYMSEKCTVHLLRNKSLPIKLEPIVIKDVPEDGLLYPTDPAHIGGIPIALAAETS